MGYYMEGEFPTIVTNGNGYNNGFGNGWEGLIGLAIVASLFGGWGNGGFGLGGRGGSGSEFVGYQLGKGATQADVASGFSTSALLNGINDLKLSNAQGFAGLNSAIANTTSTLGYNMLQGFHGVDNAVCTLGYNMASGFNTIGHQISDCCCGTQRLIERSTCDLLNAGNANTQRIIDFLTNEKIESLRAENVALKGRISNDAQSAYLIDKLGYKCPIPAYTVPNPNCCYSPCGNTTFGGTVIQ